ncbi:uncharacterized protein LOC125505864 [Dendroctonus ponderosae]|uniref:uncharacterized protein LOC125505864 n=1 Tax=Dendroctonus ponderosae TaxID=77166 RepID=UPI0020354C61|nr:uncharacterized protein LOC125505864 [Dendroctonus ponderosae]
MGSKDTAARERGVHAFYSQLPAFTDVFDEESFYIFAYCMVCTTLVIVFILSRFITIKPVD